MVVPSLEAFRTSGHDRRSRPGAARLRLEFGLPGNGHGLGRIGFIPLRDEVVNGDLARAHRDFQIAALGLERLDPRAAVEVDARLFGCIRLEGDDPDRLVAEFGP